MSSLIETIGDFLIDCMLPFVVGFFTSNLGIVFVSMCALVVIFGCIRSIMKY